MDLGLDRDSGQARGKFLIELVSGHAEPAGEDFGGVRVEQRAEYVGSQNILESLAERREVSPRQLPS